MTVGRVRGCQRAAAMVAAVMMLPPPAFAGDGIAAAGRRLVAEAARVATPASPVGRRPGGQRPSAMALAERAEVQAPGLTRSSMSRGKKLAIGVGLAVAFGAIVWAIDQGVEDNTPSSRGLR
jgi:hypothetical protein